MPTFVVKRQLPGITPDQLQGARAVLGISEPTMDSAAVTSANLYNGLYVGGRGNREFEVTVEGPRLEVRETVEDAQPTHAWAIAEHEFALVDAPMDRIVFDVRDGVAHGYSVYWDGLFWNFRRASR